MKSIKVADLLDVIVAKRVNVREVRCYLGGRCEVDILADFDIVEDGCDDEAVLNRVVDHCYARDDDPNYIVITVMRKEVKL